MNLLCQDGLDTERFLRFHFSDWYRIEAIYLGIWFHQELLQAKFLPTSFPPPEPQASDRKSFDEVETCQKLFFSPDSTSKACIQQICVIKKAETFFSPAHTSQSPLKYVNKLRGIKINSNTEAYERRLAAIKMSGFINKPPQSLCTRFLRHPFLLPLIMSSANVKVFDRNRGSNHKWEWREARRG